MTIEQVLSFVGEVILNRTGKPLSDLQATILREAWQGKKYVEIADIYGCTEGHAKDAGSFLWQVLSEACSQKITKNNFRTVITKYSTISNDPYQTTAIKNLCLENASFLGRRQELEDLGLLTTQGKKLIVIQGQGGIGKTTLAKNFLESQQFEFVLELLMAKEANNIISVATIVKEWLKRDFGEEPGKEFGVTLARFKRHLLEHKVGILIDNLEPALDKQGQLITQQKNYLELFRILEDLKIQGTTIITSRDRFCESALNLTHYRLSGLSLTDWQHFFQSNNIVVTNSCLPDLHRIYGGNPKAMGILCGIIQEDFQSNIAAYWQENQYDPLVTIDLKNLVTQQFDRLQQLDRFAYLLLCRLGCYRYQDVAVVNQAGLLALLGDVKVKNKKLLIESLRNRSLVEFEGGNYWLHPVIKAEALSRLDQTQWQQVNRQIAQFYTNSIEQINSIQDGLVALEAYYHYYAIADFNAAGKVILYSRTNQWGQHLTLGTHLYRLGLSQPLLTAIERIIGRITKVQISSELNNILGDLYWISGQVRSAIKCQESTIKMATERLQKISLRDCDRQDLYYWKMLQVDSWLSLGLYNLDLWELEKARHLFTKVIKFAGETEHNSWAEKATIVLALVDSYLGNNQSATETTTKYLALIKQDINKVYNTGRFAYFLQILGQTLINLQQYETAKKILTKAIAFCQESHYLQIKGKALTGLAIIHRHLDNLPQTCQHHQEAIQILETIGAKCDLAEAYYQYSLTLAKIDSPNFQIYQEKAIDLFQQMDAPQQILKVKQNQMRY